MIGVGLERINENRVFRLNSRRSPKEVKLLNLEWAVITQLDGEKSVGQISEILALNSLESQEIFKKLLQEGLLEEVKTSAVQAFLPPETVDELEYELKLLIGPVASIIMKDVLGNLRTDPGKIPVMNLPLFIDLLSSQITDKTKRILYQENTYPILQTYIFKENSHDYF